MKGQILTREDLVRVLDIGNAGDTATAPPAGRNPTPPRSVATPHPPPGATPCHPTPHHPAEPPLTGTAAAAIPSCGPNRPTAERPAAGAAPAQIARKRHAQNPPVSCAPPRRGRGLPARLCGLGTVPGRRVHPGRNALPTAGRDHRGPERRAADKPCVPPGRGRGRQRGLAALRHGTGESRPSRRRR